MFKTIKAAHAAAALAALLAHGAWAATYYVRASGSDSNNGTSPSTAFRTITRAMTVARNNDVVWVGAGTYNESITPSFAGLSAARRLRLVGDTDGAKTGDAGTVTITRPSGTVLNINRNFVSVERVVVAGGTDAVVWSGNSGRLSGVTIEDFADDGLVASGAGLTLRTVAIRDGADAAIEMSGGTATVDWRVGTVSDTSRGVVIGAGTLTVQRVRFSSFAGAALAQTGGSATLINCVLDGGGTGVSAVGVASNRLFLRNCTLANLGTGVSLRGVTTTVTNTIFSGMSAGVSRISPTPATTLTHTNNLYWSVTTPLSAPWSTGATDVQADPAFVNAASGNFALGAASAAANAGTATSAPANDFLGCPRPLAGSHDIGAYERGVTPAGTPYFADFQTAGSTPGAEWSVTSRTLNTAGLTRAIGNFGNEDLTLQLATTPGVRYTLIFDLYTLDTWDGDSASNGGDAVRIATRSAVLVEDTFARSIQTPSTSPYTSTLTPFRWTSNLGGQSSADGRWRVVARFTATDAQTPITFSAENLQSLADESWALDNVRVVATAQEGPYIAPFAEVGRPAQWSRQCFTANPSTFRTAPLLWCDMNADGLLDSLQGGNAATHALLNNGGGWSATSLPGASWVGAVTDYNNDRVPEAWRTTDGSAFQAGVYTSTWTPVVFANPIAGVSGVGAVAAADFNADGALDLALMGTGGNYVALNRGDNGSGVYPGFTMSTAILPQGASNTGTRVQCSSGDVNNDGAADIFLHAGGGRLFRSAGTGVYSALPIATANPANAAYGSAMGDYDNDGDLDIFVGINTAAVTTPYLFRNNNAGAGFANVASSAGLNAVPNAVNGAWGDYDNDGDLDLAVVTTAGQAAIATNSGAPSYTFTVAPMGVEVESRGGDVAWIDYDNDGDLDLAFSSWSTAHWTRLFRNDLPVTSNSLRVRVLGRGLGGINAAGVGARLELWDEDNAVFLARRDVGAARGMGSCEPLWAHFGGINAAATYTLRVAEGSKTYAVTLQPATSSTTIGARTLPRFYTFDESMHAAATRIVRWREVGDED
ncbi:MAG TPA: FG-GAP-like repeat-containing protein [Phycisphaerales bacterium]|nr:FG-GAP-like repeat-containing protein [Phycisphaerales bacterium]